MVQDGEEVQEGGTVSLVSTARRRNVEFQWTDLCLEEQRSSVEGYGRTSRPQPVLADENKIVRDAGLVVGGSLLLALCAQISIPLWFTPVPITGQTLGVLLIGAALGSRRGGARDSLVSD